MYNSKQSFLNLADWRRQIGELYAQIRHNSNPKHAWDDFCVTRNRLFANHPQTPLNSEQLARFSQLGYFEYQSQWRIKGRVETAVSTRPTYKITLSADGELRYSRIAQIHFTIQKKKAILNLFWIEGYGGGLFLPFQDATNGKTTYGGGRYLFDSIKGADLGFSPSGDIFLDFNFSYNPSCAYNDQWVCPLSPSENRLSFSINAGETNFLG